MSQALTTGAHHVGLAVPDLTAAVDFFCSALGYKEVGGNPAYPSVFVSDGSTLLTLWQVEDPASAVAFDRRKNVGLHHLALGVADHEALDRVHERIAAHPGTVIEFAPGPMRPGSATSHLICLMPGGIRLEFATPFA
ncbi:VOC family protein [Erythrobacter sp.]|uniref:VOC family protein n=1 Tax=Erythrobacter sp. TaxID=1042 RepID=UPI00311F8399